MSSNAVVINLTVHPVHKCNVSFSTEGQFRRRITEFMDSPSRDRTILVIQSELVNETRSLNLVECARYIIQDVVGRSSRECFQICLVLHIPRVAGGFFTGLSVAPWASAHIDELRSSPHTFIDVAKIRGSTVGEILAPDSGLVNLERMIVDCVPEAASHLIRDANQCCLEISRRVLDISRW